MTVSIPRPPWYPKIVPVVVDLDVKDELITRHGMIFGSKFSLLEIIYPASIIKFLDIGLVIYF